MVYLEVLAAVFFVTLPFGFYRAYTRKFSLRWFLAIHLPVPLVFLARFEAHLPYTFIPFTTGTFCMAQFGGSYVGRWWIKHRLPAAAQEESSGDRGGTPAKEASSGCSSPPPEPGVNLDGSG